MSEQSDGQSSPSNSAALGAMATEIFDRLISHSRFVPVMLNLKDSLLPLPAAAQKLKLRSPFGSILPLVESPPYPQVCSSSGIIPLVWYQYGYIGGPGCPLILDKFK